MQGWSFRYLRTSQPNVRSTGVSAYNPMVSARSQTRRSKTALLEDLFTANAPTGIIRSRSESESIGRENFARP
jgi:hypothetical protein